jgi:putative peptidoglycan lipid II flippase
MADPASPPRRSAFLDDLIPGTLRRSLTERREVLLLMALTIGSKPFGFLVQFLIASSFGASAGTDAYFVAFFLATFLANIGIQVFTTLVVPLYFDHAARNDEAGTLAFLNAVLLFFTAPLVLFAVVLLAVPRLAIALAAPGFSGEALAQTETMTRIMAAGTIVTGLSGYLSALLNVRRVFWLPGLVPILQACLTIAGILLLRDALGPYVLASCFLAAALLGFVIQGAAALHLGLLRAVAPRWGDPILRRLRDLLGPVVLSALIVQALFMVDRIIASGLDEGSVSALSYANTINMLALQIVAGTFVTVLFTDLASLISRGDMPGFRAAFHRDTRYLLTLMVPFAVVVLVRSEEIVAVLFGHGRFDEAAGKATASALVMYALGLPMLGVNMLLGRVFHALKEMSARMAIDLAWLLTNVVASLLLVGPMGIAGLALGTSIASTVNVALSVIYLRRRHGGVGEAELAKTLGESVLAGLAMAGVVAWVHAGGGGDWEAPRLERALALCGAGALGLLAYAMTLVAVRLARTGSRRVRPG